MKRIALFAFLFLLAVSAHAANLHGAWTATRGNDTSGRLHLNMSYGSHNQVGHSFDLAALQGLSEAQVAAASQVPVKFELRREAGTVSFHGSFERGDGAGQFDFTPDRGYFRVLESMGVRVDAAKETDERLLTFALLDLSTSFVRDMRAEGYDVDVEKYLSMRIFGVTREIISQYRRLGYDKIPYSKLIALRVHGVTPEYIEQMRKAGFSSLSLDDLTTSRIHGATPEFLGAMRAAGYADLTFDDLVSFRIHGVTPDFIRELHTLGYDKVSADQLVALRIHGVTPEYIRGIQAAGYKNVPLDTLVGMRIRGIDEGIVKKMR